MKYIEKKLRTPLVLSPKIFTYLIKKGMAVLILIKNKCIFQVAINHFLGKKSVSNEIC